MDIGRRLLLAQLDFSSWVLRRVEKVKFENERNISRSTSIELRVRDDAPILRDSSGRDHWLVPLTLMRRRTLVNLDLRDEESRSISLLGLRFTQQLDIAMLRAAAAARDPHRGADLPADLETIIERAVAGSWHEVCEAKVEVERLVAEPPEDLRPYLEDPTFMAILERLWSNFTVYVTLPRDRGRHRIIRMKFEEPTRWQYQKPSLTSEGSDVIYRPFADLHRWPSAAARLGWRATRVRFLTPSAEYCASYHFEFTAPTGLKVARAALLAGRPNISEGQVGPPVTVDDMGGQGPSAGLHGVEIVNGSLSRAQIDLRVVARGWLSTILVACVAVCMVVGSVVLYGETTGERPSEWGDLSQVIGLLLAVSAGAATFVAYHHAGEVVQRMVTWLRGVAMIAISMPAVTAGWLVYFRVENEVPDWGEDPRLVWLFFVISIGCTFIVLVAWLSSFRMGRRTSPWDMSDLTAKTPDAGMFATRKPREASWHFRNLEAELGFDKKAIGVYSAEGWLTRYNWTHVKQQRAIAALSRPFPVGARPQGD